MGGDAPERVYVVVDGEARDWYCSTGALLAFGDADDAELYRRAAAKLQPGRAWQVEGVPRGDVIACMDELSRNDAATAKVLERHRVAAGSGSVKSDGVDLDFGRIRLVRPSPIHRRRENSIDASDVDGSAIFGVDLEVGRPWTPECDETFRCCCRLLSGESGVTVTVGELLRFANRQSVVYPPPHRERHSLLALHRNG